MKNRIFNKMLLTIYLADAINPSALFFDDTPYCNHVRQRLQKAIQDGYVKEYSYVEKYGTHLRDQSYLALTAKGVCYLSACADFSWLQYIPFLVWISSHCLKKPKLPCHTATCVIPGWAEEKSSAAFGVCCAPDLQAPQVPQRSKSESETQDYHTTFV